MFLIPGVNNLLVFEFPTWFTTMTPISTKFRMAMLMKPMTIDFFRVLPVGGTRWFKWSPCCLWFLCAVALSRFGGFSVLALKIKFTEVLLWNNLWPHLPPKFIIVIGIFMYEGVVEIFIIFCRRIRKRGVSKRESHIFIAFNWGTARGGNESALISWCLENETSLTFL